MLDTLMTSAPLLAKALITWTPLTFYVAVAIVHVVAIVIASRVLQVDEENNIFVGALIVGAAAAAAGYFLKGNGLVGLLVTGSTLFGTLLAVTAGDALKSLIIAGLCIATYAGVGQVVLPRTPLNTTDVGGFAQAFMDGLEEEAIAGEDDLYEHTKPKVDDATK